MKDKQKKILVVEDEGLIAVDLVRLIRKFNYSPLVAVTSGPEAIEAVQCHEPDIVLMDITLEGEMNGITAAREISRFSDVPVIFITSNSSSRLTDSALKENPYGYIIKPFSETELKYAIILALQKIDIIREISKNRDEMKRVKEFYDTVLHSMTDWVAVINRETEIVFTNESFNALFGGSLRSAFHEFLRDENGSAGTGLLDIAFSARTRSQKETTFVDADGKKRTYRITASPVVSPDRDTAMAVLSGSDVSLLMEQQRSIALMRELLDTIIQNVPTGIILTSGTGIITMVNNTFEHISGFPSRDLVGKNTAIIFKEDFQEIIGRAYRVGTRDYVPREIEIRRADDSLFLAKALTFYFERPVIEDYTNLFFVSDISFEKKLEMKQVRLQNQIESIIREMDELSEMLLETNVYNESIKRGLHDFDPTDRRIIKYTEQGLPNSEIARRMGMAEITVKKRLSLIYAKLGVSNKYQLIQYVLTHFIPDK